MNINAIQDLEKSGEIFNACDSTYCADNVTSEYQVVIEYKDGEYEIPDHSYNTLAESIAVAKEWYDADSDNISHIEIWLQVTAWIDNNPETVGDSLICSYRK